MTRLPQSQVGLADQLEADANELRLLIFGVRHLLDDALADIAAASPLGDRIEAAAVLASTCERRAAQLLDTYGKGIRHAQKTPRARA